VNFRLLVACGLALVALGAAIGVVAAVSDHSDPARPAAQFVGPRMPSGLRAFDFTLRDQHGRRFSLDSTRGKVVALTFIHSNCTSTCPVTLQTIRGALDDLEDMGVDRREVDVLALTVDPEADTRRSVRRFLTTQHASDFVRYLTASRARMRPIWKRYGIAPQGKGQEDHTAFVLLVDRRGILRIGFPSHEMTPEDLANDLHLLLAEKASA
jgi:protein SCO1/2